MKLEFNKKYTTIAIYAFLVLAAVVLFGLILNKISYFYSICSMIIKLLTPFIYAFGIAYILNPILKWVERVPLKLMRLGKPRRFLSLAISYLFMAGILTIFLGLVLPQLIVSIRGLVTNLLRYINSAETWVPYLLQYFPDLDVNATIMRYFRESTSTLLETIYAMFAQLLPWMTNFSARMAGGLLNVVVGIIISVYMLSNKELFGAGCKRIVYASLPHQKADWLLELASDANRIFGGFIGGKILDSVIIALICFVCLRLLSVPNALLVSVIVGVTNVIPYFGPFIGAIPSFIIILIEDPIKSVVFLVFILILQQFDGNILGPKILGDSTGLSAFWVIFSIMLFGGLWGFLGMFLGVPVFSVLFMLVGRLIKNSLNKRGMPLEMSAYCAPEAPILPSGKGPGQSKERHSAHTVKQVEHPQDNDKQ